MFLKLNFFLNLLLDTKIISTNQSKSEEEIKNDCGNATCFHTKIKILYHMLSTEIKLSILKLNHAKLRSRICTCIFFFYHFNRSFPPLNSDLKTKCQFLLFTKLVQNHDCRLLLSCLTQADLYLVYYETILLEMFCSKLKLFHIFTF